jgi:hypothetical protein
MTASVPPETGAVCAKADSETPEQGWPAQANLTPREVFLQVVREDVATLTVIADSLEKPGLLRRVSVREELRRRLAGVVAHCETLRLALDKRGA